MSDALSQSSLYTIYMSSILLSIATFVSTFIGGVFSLRYRDKMHKIMGFTAGVLLGVVFFDIFPEIIELIKENNLGVTSIMVALVFGFLFFHIVEKSVIIHHAHEDDYGEHKHPHVGILSALALAGHS